MYMQVTTLIDICTINVYELNDPPSYLFTPLWAVCLQLLYGLVIVVIAWCRYRKKIGLVPAALLTLACVAEYLKTEFFW